MKPVKVIFSPEAEEAYNKLNAVAADSKVERSILNSIDKKKDLIKANPHYGEPIAKDKIPDEYRIKYGATNLFLVELSNFWRMLYTLTNNETEVEIIAFVLDIIDHEKYNKKLGYKKH
ncbi:MAG: type II toxin-antitoxin system RelE/ParE family toxin [Candidatus Woesearchaeota archaeon]|nr:MAG: type II toxin-antitoxin system RelE/ParE family toxin [Candidatus Woesearchaeota archaeon]